MDQVVRAKTEPGFLLPVFDQELVALNAFIFTITGRGSAFKNPPTYKRCLHASTMLVCCVVDASK